MSVRTQDISVLFKSGPICLGTRMLFKYSLDSIFELYKEYDLFFVNDHWLKLKTNSNIFKVKGSTRVQVYSYIVSVSVKQTV